jgi:hypothetical protein
LFALREINTNKTEDSPEGNPDEFLANKAILIHLQAFSGLMKYNCPNGLKHLNGPVGPPAEPCFHVWYENESITGFDRKRK